MPRILVVEDDQDMRELLRLVLEMEGFEVVDAPDGPSALHELERHDVSLVLLDNRLPGMDGLDVLGRLRADRRSATLPVILVTGDDDVTDRVRGLRAGADDYVIKPFTPSELVARVAAQLRGREAWQRAIETRLEERAALVRSLRDDLAELEVEDVAQLVCERVVELDGVRGAGLFEVTREGAVIPAAVVGRRPLSAVPGSPLPRAAATALVARARVGPWTDDANGGEPHLVAFAPIGDRAAPVAVLAVAFRGDDGETPAMCNAALATAVDLAEVVDAAIGTDLRRRRRRGHRTDGIAALLAGGDFVPHFQPIRRLSDGTIVGVEALTRFSDGVAPDVRFHEAAELGVGLALELATMERAVKASMSLPETNWLALNVSPDLIRDTDRLHDVLDLTTSEVVLELSEQQPVRDYGEIRRAVADLPGRVRLSVDDAGSGFASLQHILELRPQFMKLDRSWVHDVHADPARQALIVGLRHFADRVGAQLIAEGIERPEELDTLRELEVELGQGFLLGRPMPASA